MRVIGLTGGIACGKSTVSGWLREQPGCCVIDGDQISRQLTAPGGSALPRIRETFGDRVFLADGTLNRRGLGNLVFSQPAAREQLDALMAPLLEEATRLRLQRAREEGAALCFLDYPLLFEKGYDRLCDAIWCVTLPREIQLQRLMDRDVISREEALRWMDAVLSTEEKARRSTAVIDNSGTVSYTLSLLPPLLEAERRQAETAGSGPRRRRAARYGTNESESGPEPSPVPPEPAPSVTQRTQVPEVMDRPDSARRKPSERKVQWHIPSWLMGCLIAVFFLLLGGITAQSLMQAWLTRQTEAHYADARAILGQYPLEYRDMIVSAAEEYNLSPAFVASIIRNESSFQPRAESGVGARGLMQLMPDTAEWIAGKTKTQGYAFDRMYDPESNIRFGCWYLNYLSTLFRGDPVCVACAYHAGQGQVNAWLSDPGISSDGHTLDLDRMADGPTKTYARRVIKTYGIYQTLYFDGADIYDVLLPRAGQQRGEQPGDRHPEQQNPDHPAPASGGAGHGVPL